MIGPFDRVLRFPELRRQCSVHPAVLRPQERNVQLGNRDNPYVMSGLPCPFCEGGGQSVAESPFISLVPRIDFAASRTPVRILKEEEPFCCIRCGKPFGVKSSIERVVARLEGRHWMYAGEAR